MPDSLEPVDRPWLDFLPGDVPDFLTRPNLLLPDRISLNASDFGEINSDGSFDLDGDFDSIRQTASQLGEIIGLSARSGFDEDSLFFDLKSRGEVYQIWDDELSYRHRLRLGGPIDRDEKWAIYIEAVDQRRQSGTVSHETTWGRREVDGTPLTFIDEFEILHTPILRDRQTLGFNLDWRPSENTRAYLRSVWRERRDLEQSQRLEYDTNLDASDSYPYDTTSDRIRNGLVIAGTIRDDVGRLERKLKDETEHEKILGFQSGFEHLFPSGARIGLRGEWARELKTEPDRQDIEYRLREFGDSQSPGYRYELGNGLEPSILNNPLGVTRVRLNDPSAFDLSKIEKEDNIKKDLFGLAALDASIPIRLTNQRGKLAMGLHYLRREKERDIDYQRFEPVDGRSFTMDEVAGGLLEESGSYAFGPTIDPSRARQFFNEHRNDLELQANESHYKSLAEDYDVSEDVFATYLMASLYGETWAFNAGLRLEHSDSTHEGYLLNWDGLEPRVNRRGVLLEGLVERQAVSESQSDTHLLPGIQWEWDPQPDTRISLSWTHEVWRPRLRDLSPTVSATADLNDFGNPEESEIIAGNAELDPAWVSSIDLRLDHFLPPVGYASAQVFYRRIDDPIALTTSSRPFTDPFGVEREYLVEEPLNGQSGYVAGFRLDLARQFTWLPDPVDGLGLFLSYQYNYSRQNLTIDGQDRDVALLETPEHSARLGLFYQKHQFFARLGWQFQSKFLLSVGEDPKAIRGGGDLWVDDYGRLDLTMEYALGRHWELFFEARNLTNERRALYEGSQARLVDVVQYGRSFRVGLHSKF